MSRAGAWCTAGVRCAGVLLAGAAALTGCVSLDRFYAQVPATAQIGIDPIGGYLLFYWIDAQGTVCHGAPGSTGQPGPAAVTAAKPAAIQDAIARAPISQAQLQDYQLIAYDINPYLASNAAGAHLLQFDNLLWRDRGTGKAFRDAASHYYSIPQAVDVGNLPTTVKPVFAFGIDACDVAGGIVIPSGPFPDEPAQHPTRCRVKAFPPPGVITKDPLLANCVKRLPEGSSYREY